MTSEPAVALTALEGGRACLLGVRAQPGAKRSGVVGLWNARVKVALRAPPQDGRANEELLEVLAEALGVRGSALAIVRGERARVKDVRVDCALDTVRRRLRDLLAKGAPP